MKKIALAAAAILGVSMMGMASNYPESADFIYTGTNDREAARLLMKSMQALNRDWEVEWYSEKNGVLIVSRELDDDESTLKPVLIVGVTTLSKGLDRVSMTALFTGRPGNEKDLGALQFINKLNRTVTGATFSFGDDGGVAAQAYHDFRNVLQGRDLHQLFRDFDNTLKILLDDKEIAAGFARYVISDASRPDRDA